MPEIKDGDTRTVTCIYVPRMLAIAEGGKMFTAEEFDKFMSHEAGEPCRDCARFDPEDGLPTVSPEEYALWEKAWERIVTGGVPGALPTEERDRVIEAYYAELELAKQK